MTPTWVAPDGAAETRISVRPKRQLRAQFVSRLGQDLPAVATVLAAGVAAIRSEREGGALALAAAELLVGVWILATVAWEARHLFGREVAHGHHAARESRRPSRVDVLGLAAAALGYVEVWHRAHELGRFKIVSPLMLSATVALFFAFGGRQWIRRRFGRRGPHFSVTSERITYRGGGRRRWAAAWDEVAGLEHGPDHLSVRLRDGRTHVLRGADHFGGETLIEDARAAVARHAPRRVIVTVAEPGVSRS